MPQSVRPGRCLRGSTENNLRSSPFCRPQALSCVTPSLIPPRAMHHLSEGMRLVALCHTEMARELSVLRAAVSSAMELVLGHSPSGTVCMDVVDEFATKFQKMEDRRSWLERPAARIYDLLLGPPTCQARLADHLDEATGQLRVELAAWWEAYVELEALWTLAMRVWDLVLGRVNRSSSLAASMSTTAELHEGRINAAAANRVRWGSRSTLVAIMSHFLELEVPFYIGPNVVCS
jgi:hypothetical protein